MKGRRDFNEADFICPLSEKIFLDPVKLPSGETVEREVIEKWVKQKNENPFTHEPLKVEQLVPDEEMKKKVNEFLAENPDRKNFQYVLEEAALTCPLSQQIFLDPVKLPSGATVERQVIETWIQIQQTGRDPFTRQPLALKDLVKDKEMEKRVSEFLMLNPDKKMLQYTLSATSPQSQAPGGPSAPSADDLLAMREAMGLGTDIPREISIQGRLFNPPSPAPRPFQRPGTLLSQPAFFQLDVIAAAFSTFLRERIALLGLTLRQQQAILEFIMFLTVETTLLHGNQRQAWVQQQTWMRFDVSDVNQQEEFRTLIQQALSFVDRYKMHALLLLRGDGLTIEHLRSCTWDWEHGAYYRDALLRLMTQPGADRKTADQAVAELEGLNWQQVQRIAYGETREQVLREPRPPTHSR